MAVILRICRILSFLQRRAFFVAYPYLYIHSPKFGYCSPRLLNWPEHLLYVSPSLTVSLQQAKTSIPYRTDPLMVSFCSNKSLFSFTLPNPETEKFFFPCISHLLYLTSSQRKALSATLGSKVHDPTDGASSRSLESC